MSTQSISERRQYLTTGELREEIAYAVGGHPSRYGPRSGKGLKKATVRRVAEQLQPADSDLRLHECDLVDLYRHVCEWAGGEYQPNAGNAWGINRANLKLIHRELGARDPTEAVTP
jgi:hypothetical protein